MVRRIAVVAGSLAAIAGPVVAQARMAANLNTHSEITIDRPAAAVWPHIVDPNDWKQGAKSWHHAGPVGQVGEVFAAGDPADKEKAAFLFENVELKPNLRRTIKLYARTGALIGYASWWLRPVAGRTVVGYDVFSETLIDPAQANGTTPEKLRELERSGMETNKARFDQELQALKRLVERGKPGAG
jgi:hypothetical protein